MRARSKARHGVTVAQTATASLKRESRPPFSNSTGLFGPALLRMQRMAGNAAVARMAAAIQREPERVGAPDGEQRSGNFQMTAADIGTFPIVSVSMSAPRKPGRGTNSDEPGGAHLEEILMTKEGDEHTPKLHQAAVEGTKIATAEVRSARLLIEGKDVFITSFQISGSGEKHLESYTFSAGGPGFVVQPQPPENEP